MRFLRYGLPGSLALMVALATLASSQQPGPFKVPVTGKAGQGLEPFDQTTLATMDRHGIPGAALAIAKDGKLVLAKGYGWSDVGADQAVQPDTLFTLASLSKPITAVAVLKLVEQGKLRLDDKVFEILDDIRPPRGAVEDPRLRTITIRQLLNHSGGWNRSVSGDPINWTAQIGRQLGVRGHLTAPQLVSFMRGVPLDFDPGTQNQYSNVGYIILGLIITKTTGQPYGLWVRKNVLEPMGLRRCALSQHNGRYLPGQSLSYMAGTIQPVPPVELPMLDPAGGWVASAIDMVRFLTALDGSRVKPFLDDKTMQLMLAPPPPPLKPLEDGRYVGLGWDVVLPMKKRPVYWKDGSWNGARTFMKHTENGVSWALLFNASMQPDAIDSRMIAATVHEIRETVEKMQKLPDIDLFKEFP